MAEGGFPNYMLEYANDNENREDIEYNLPIPNDEVVLELRIIAKTIMKRGFCYLALDQTNGRILRPILKRSKGKWCWPTQSFELELGYVYKFQVITHPDNARRSKPIPQCNEDMIETEMPLSQTFPQSPLNSSSFVLSDSDLQYIFGYFTPFPHCNEDMIVTEFVELQQISSQPPLQSLLSSAKLDVEDIFGSNVIKEHCYVDENTHCSSAGILRCTAYLEYNESKTKYCCKVECKSGTYNMPVKVIGIEDIDTKPILYPDALIVLGLGRPFVGKQKYCPARCYLLVVGIYPLP
ncbi:unnamed protein product [Mytilus coruscus]|uniref:Uncharacterized protein n=1 Tax=Mytilus coruscus TaxID=42192 RepID=A0A6J8B6E1_MYTCO|nr:unnamed protein product [Mytilus coruscus]